MENERLVEMVCRLIRHIPLLLGAGTLVVFMVGAGVAVASIWSEHQQFDERAEAWRSVSGLVAGTGCPTPRMIAYRYEVAGRRYEGIGRVADAGLTCRTVQDGAPITVSYDPQRPEQSMTGSPAELRARAASEMVFTPLMLMAMGGAVASLVTFLGYRRQNRPRA